MPDRPQEEVLLRTFSFKKARRVSEAVSDARKSRPRPGPGYGHPLALYTCWRTFPKFWTAYGGIRSWLKGPWEKHWLLPPWTVVFKRWPDYEDYGWDGIYGKQSNRRCVSTEAWSSFVERMKKPWKLD
jgi:hypothetical protein